MATAYLPRTLLHPDRIFIYYQRTKKQRMESIRRSALSYHFVKTLHCND